MAQRKPKSRYLPQSLPAQPLPGVPEHGDTPSRAAVAAGKPRRLPPKRERIITLFLSGVKDVAELALYTQARPSYVAQVLQAESLLQGYVDLYTPTSRIPNAYAAKFKDVLHFRDVETARASVRRIHELYMQFEAGGDRAGQHHAMSLALTGFNRARFSGKLDEARPFRDWLLSMLGRD